MNGALAFSAVQMLELSEFNIYQDTDQRGSNIGLLEDEKLAKKGSIIVWLIHETMLKPCSILFKENVHFSLLGN